jgi:hypothetical protein
VTVLTPARLVTLALLARLGVMYRLNHVPE